MGRDHADPSWWGVELVEWPSGADVRRHLALAGVPRLLVVEAGAAPPADLAPDEGWIRVPYGDDDLAARLREVARCAPHCSDPAWVGPDRVLHVGPATLTLSPAQALVTQALLDAHGAPVSPDALLMTLSGDGHHRQVGAIEVLVSRLRRRLVNVGLTVRCVRGQGYLLAE